MTVFSTKRELQRIAAVLRGYTKLPFADEVIPGVIMETVLAHVHGGRRLSTYDFVDVIDTKRKRGWQIKSTKAKTPVTWKRAKIPNKAKLIRGSLRSTKARQELGDAIINFCNSHAAESLRRYDLDEIGYARLIIHDNGQVVYFERELCSKKSPAIFTPEDFTWRWSVEKKPGKKEQLPALHGFHRKTAEKWWAWHGRGENQLHFSGESAWWPDGKGNKSFTFHLPTERLTVEEFLALLASASAT